MARDEIKNTDLRIVGRIMLEDYLTQIKPQDSFRKQLDVDSIDF